MKQITNETGTFYIDDSGVLLRYEHTPKMIYTTMAAEALVP